MSRAIEGVDVLSKNEIESLRTTMIEEVIVNDPVEFNDSTTKLSDSVKQPVIKKNISEEEVDRMFAEITQKDLVGKTRETNLNIDIEIDLSDD